MTGFIPPLWGYRNPGASKFSRTFPVARSDELVAGGFAVPEISMKKGRAPKRRPLSTQTPAQWRFHGKHSTP